MKYFMVTAKCGHVGRNNFYKGKLFFKAESRKEAARFARDCPRVKHDRKDAILKVEEIDFDTFEMGREINHSIHYYTCENLLFQRKYLSEIEDDIYLEDSVYEEKKKMSKKHSLRVSFNIDPSFEFYKKNSYIDYYSA